MSPRYTPSSFRTATPFYLALLLLFLSLLVSYACGYVLYLQFRVAKTDEVGSSLILAAELSRDMIAESVEYTMLSLLREEEDMVFDRFREDSQWLGWFENLDSFEEESSRVLGILRFLSRKIDSGTVLLISPQKRVIVDASGRSKPGEPAPVGDADLAAWDSALTGKALTAPHERDKRPFIRVFSPVRILEGRNAGYVGAILMFETDFEGFSKIKDWERKGFAMAAVIAALSATIALLFYRLMRRLVHVREAAAHSDRLQAMGTLTAGISHEIRNPLGIIRALAEGMSDDFEPDDHRRRMLDDIIGEVHRLNGLVNQYLQFARPSAAKSDEQARPDELIRALVPLLQKGDKESHPLEVELADNVPPVQMNEFSLRQVLLNLLMNAMEASEKDQAISIKCAPLRGRSQVQIVVADKGAGIAPRDLRRVFDPFYTTHHHGTGLGLPICRQLVTECHGKIQIESALGVGTTLRIILPAGDRQDKRSENATSQKNPG